MKWIQNRAKRTKAKIFQGRFRTIQWFSCPSELSSILFFASIIYLITKPMREKIHVQPKKRSENENVIVTDNTRNERQKKSRKKNRKGQTDPWRVCGSTSHFPAFCMSCLVSALAANLTLCSSEPWEVASIIRRWRRDHVEGRSCLRRRSDLPLLVLQSGLRIRWW